MTITILGVSAYYHDSAAALIRDGKIVGAAQEERFSRIKHDPRFPTQAIRYCLEAGQCAISDIDAVVFYDKPLLKFERLLETYLANAPRGIRSFIRAMPVWLKEKLYLKSLLRRELRDIGGLDKKATLPKLLFSEHHLSHAASAFFPSPFDDATVLCLDGVGEWTTSSAWQANNNRITPLWEIHFPHSLGLLYSAFTFYAGFKVNSGEYKLMGLAPYGEAKYVELIYQHLVDVKDDGSFALNMAYFDYATGSKMTNDKFHALFGGQPRASDSELTQKEMDLARSIQVATEEIVLKIVAHLSKTSPSKNLCLAGGVALNCVANGRLQRESAFEKLWIQPAAGDAGGALGAALVSWHHYYDGERKSNNNQDTMDGAQLGPSYSNEAIKAAIAEQNLPFSELKHQEMFERTGDLLAAGKVIGWFQGRMEFGPRALGNRSIIGDPRNPQMQRIMNVKIKQRESFRPFAPAVLVEDVGEYFEVSGEASDAEQPNYESPYMLLTAQLKNELLIKQKESADGLELLNQHRSQLPAITHVDNSARVQTVSEKTNPEFYHLLQKFKSKTGCAVLINTSFNVRGEPPVCSPLDALRCFLATDMDYLVMGDMILDKQAQPSAAIDKAKAVSFAPD